MVGSRYTCVDEVPEPDMGWGQIHLYLKVFKYLFSKYL